MFAVNLLQPTAAVAVGSSRHISLCKQCSVHAAAAAIQSIVAQSILICTTEYLLESALPPIVSYT